ncbi:hypothetical protein Tco_0509608 [Tanacetum coccineum]
MSSDSASSEVEGETYQCRIWALRSKQAPLSPDYVSGPEYPEYLAPSDKEVPVEDQPYVVADSPIALSPGYVADSDLEEDSKDGLVDYPADGGDDDDDDSSDNERRRGGFRERSILGSGRTLISVRPETPIHFPSEEEVEKLLALPPPPPPSPLISLSPPLSE